MATTKNLTGFDLLQQKEQRLADKATEQAEWLAQHPGWMPCAHRFERPDGVESGPERIVCFGTVKPEYQRKVEFAGKIHIVAECPRAKDHSTFREMVRRLGWLKTA